MAENDLIITLKTIDEASEPIKTSLASIRADIEKLKNKIDEAGTSIKDQFKQIGRELKDLRQAAFLFTAALGTIIAATREAAKYNKEAKTTYEQFTRSIQSLSVMVGTALGPALNGVTALINLLRDTITAVIAGFIKMFVLITESFTALWEGIKNIGDNIKNIFTGKEDPVGIVEAFRTSFARAMQIADGATDEFLNKVESTRAQVEAGQTIQSQEQQQQNLNKITIEGQSKSKQGWDNLKKSVTDFGTALSGAKEMNKGFAKAAAAVGMGMAIVNTAQGVTNALAGPPNGPPWPANLAMAALVAATGAIQIATIASQSFAVGTGNLPSDMMAQVHKGETIIPATFADSIRRGELSLSGGGGAGGFGDIVINLYGVTINAKENIKELAEDLGFEIDRKLRNARTLA